MAHRRFGRAAGRAPRALPWRGTQSPQSDPVGHRRGGNSPRALARSTSPTHRASKARKAGHRGLHRRCGDQGRWMDGTSSPTLSVSAGTRREHVDAAACRVVDGVACGGVKPAQDLPQVVAQSAGARRGGSEDAVREFVGLPGRSASGTSNLLRSIAGLPGPGSGEVIVRGKPRSAARPQASRWIRERRSARLARPHAAARGRRPCPGRRSGADVVARSVRGARGADRRGPAHRPPRPVDRGSHPAAQRHSCAAYSRPCSRPARRAGRRGCAPRPPRPNPRTISAISARAKRWTGRANRLATPRPTDPARAPDRCLHGARVRASGHAVRRAPQWRAGSMRSKVLSPSR